ncbi:MAG: phage tail protein [Anaerolineae bacterium]|nr:phage tail protein [Anaerolineae bacterium]
MTRALEKDPYLSLRFRVEIGGIEAGAFSEVTGLQVEIETQDYREGGVNDYIHKLAGPVRYPSNLILKRGLMDADVLWAWQQEIAAGRVKRLNGSIILLNSAGQDKWRWDVKDAYPVRWTGPELRASRGEVAIETLELAHRGLKVQRV